MKIQTTPFGRNPFKRSDAIITASLFLLTVIFSSSPTVFAQSADLKVQGGAPSGLLRLAGDREIRIPPELGLIDEYHQGTNDKTVIYVQDAHDSLEAQENIAKIIKLLVANYGVKTVFEEGYEGPVPTDKYFSFIKDPKIKERVSYFFMDHLRVGGAEYAHINRIKDFNLVGADSLKLHKENILQYQRSVTKKEEIEKDFKALETLIQNLVDHRFPKEVKEWFKIKAQFDAKKLDLFTYLARTMPLLGKKEMNQNFGLMHFILEAVHTNDPAIIEKAKHIDAREVFGELAQVERAIAETYLHSKADKQLFEYYKILWHLDRLNDLQVSQEEYEAAKENLKAFDTNSFAEFVFSQSPQTLILSRMWEQNIKDAIKFYEIAKFRDNAIEGQLESTIKDPSETTAALVFGGFHKENIKRILEAKGTSYLVVSPRITKPDSRHEEFYKNLMTVGRLPFEQNIIATLAHAARPLPLVAEPEPVVRAEIRAVYDALLLNPKIQLGVLDKIIGKQIRSEARTGLTGKESVAELQAKLEQVALGIRNNGLMRRGMLLAVDFNALSGDELAEAKRKFAEIDAEIERLNALKRQIETAVAKKRFKPSPVLITAKQKYSKASSQFEGNITAPAAISVQVADLKFGPQGVQILEVQHGIGSAFEGYEELYDEQMMDHIWREINKIKQNPEDTELRVLYVGGDMELMLGGAEHQKTRGRAALKETGGIMIIGQMLDSALRADEIGFHRRKPGFNPTDLRTYTGVAILHSTLHSEEELDQIRAANPQLIELDRQGAVSVFLGDKLLINTLFTGTLEGARPKWRLFPKDYNPAELAKQILETLPSRSGKYIIKPIDASRGRGIIPVEADQLEEVLTNIQIQSQNRKALEEREKLEGLRMTELGEEDPYEFWAVDRGPAILVEELAESKPVEVAGKSYDGTMRVVYVMTHDKTNGTSFKIIGSYWKLPTTPIGEGSLRDVILSRIHGEGAEGEEQINSAKVSPEDQAAVAEQLENVFPELYHRMLAMEPEDAINRLLFSDRPDEVAYGIYLISRAREYSPERIERLIELANERNPYYDAYLSGLIQGIYEWNKNLPLISLIAALVNSDNPDARDTALKVALENVNFPGMLNAALSRERNVNNVTDLELRAKFIEFLRKQNRITDQDLLHAFEKIFRKGEFESQKFILRTLFERQLTLDQNANWLWNFLENEDTQLYALWFNLYVENRNRLYDRQLREAEREVRKRRRTEINVLVKAAELYETLPTDRVVRLLEIVNYEQSLKRMDWYLELAKESYEKNHDPNLARLLREAEKISIFNRMRGTRRAIDAYYSAGVVRDVISASQQAVRSLRNPQRQNLLIDELMRIPVSENYVSSVLDLFRNAVYKSGGVRIPLGNIATEQQRISLILGIPVADKLRGGTVQRELTRESAKELLTKLADHIAARADLSQPSPAVPVVVETSLQLSRSVSNALSSKQNVLAQRLRSLPEDENFARNVEKAIIEIVEDLAGTEFPLLNNYRDDGFLDFFHHRRLRGVEDDVSIATIFGINLSYWTREQREEKKLFEVSEADTVARSILEGLRDYINSRIPTQRQQDRFINSERTFVNRSEARSNVAQISQGLNYFSGEVEEMIRRIEGGLMNGDEKISTTGLKKLRTLLLEAQKSIDDRSKNRDIFQNLMKPWDLIFTLSPWLREQDSGLTISSYEDLLEKWAEYVYSENPEVSFALHLSLAGKWFGLADSVPMVIQIPDLTSHENEALEALAEELAAIGRPLPRFDWYDINWRNLEFIEKAVGEVGNLSERIRKAIILLTQLTQREDVRKEVTDDLLGGESYIRRASSHLFAIEHLLEIEANFQIKKPKPLPDEFEYFTKMDEGWLSIRSSEVLKVVETYERTGTTHLRGYDKLITGAEAKRIMADIYYPGYKALQLELENRKDFPPNRSEIRAITPTRSVVKAWQVVRLPQDVIVVVEQAKIDALSSEMFRELLQIAGLNNGKLHLVIPDALQEQYSARVAELRKVASVYYGFPRLAVSDKIPMIGFSDMEHDTLAAFQKRLDPRMAERIRDSAFGINQAGSFGVGILYALKDIPPDQLPPNQNGFRYDRSGWYSAQVLEILQAYTVISTSA